MIAAHVVLRLRIPTPTPRPLNPCACCLHVSIWAGRHREGFL